MEDQREVLVLSAVRTPIGKYGGGLASVPLCDLAATVVREAVSRAAVAPDEVGHAVFGNVIHTEIRICTSPAWPRLTGPPGRDARLHPQPAVRQWPAGDRLRRAGSPPR